MADGSSNNPFATGTPEGFVPIELWMRRWSDRQVLAWVGGEYPEDLVWNRVDQLSEDFELQQGNLVDVVRRERVSALRARARKLRAIVSEAPMEATESRQVSAVPKQSSGSPAIALSAQGVDQPKADANEVDLHCGLGVPRVEVST